jgi:glycosyltransferase involved in cell wall biosynthesis
MKILHLISSSGYFGADNMLIELARGSRSSALLPVVGIFRNVHNPHEEIGEVAKSHELPVEIFPCGGKVDLGTLLKIRRVLSRQGVDIVHTHGYKSNLYALGAAAGTGVGKIATCHNWLGDDVKMKSYARVDKLLLKRFDRVVAVSDTIREELVSGGIPTHKIDTIYNGIDLKRFEGPADTEAARKALRIRDGCRVVGTVGRLSEEKGHIYLLRAARDPALQGQNLVFLIVGDGPLRESLEKEADGMGFGPGDMLFTGTRTDVDRLYGLMDLFVLPSLTEGFPMALLEAVASKRPVVASEVGGVPKVIEEGSSGRLVKPGDAEALARAIRDVLADPKEGCRMAERAYETVRKAFSAEGMAQRYLDIYEEMASTSPTRRGRAEKGSLQAKVRNG